MDSRIAEAKSSNEDLKISDDLDQLLRDLIYVKANGFRGVVLTAIVGLHINPEYDPLNAFYDCNPRAIFEQGIWYALTENGIPCGKSDPLNVAKNINQLNESWAVGRRPQKAALAAVSFLQQLISEQQVQNKEYLINCFFDYLVKYADDVASIEIIIPENASSIGQDINQRVVDFVLTYPESGTIPQYVIGKLLEQLYSSSGYTVEGGEDSVFGTNTTSKKPADIWVRSKDKYINLYEVTVKKVDSKRLDDCLDALQIAGLMEETVTFICRIPEDIDTLDLNNPGVLDFKGKPFYFIDISAFIHSTLALLSQEQIKNFMVDLASFVEDVNRPIATKEGWRATFVKTSS